MPTVHPFYSINEDKKTRKRRSSTTTLNAKLDTASRFENASKVPATTDFALCVPDWLGSDLMADRPAGSCNPQYPPLYGSDFSLFRRQRRIQEAIQIVALVCPLQPRRHGIGGLLVTITTLPRETPCPQ